ncbi:MAG: 1,4-dihydroxy-2-naphthoate polyprenyltransferase [Jiangellaceae bacterium]
MAGVAQWVEGARPRTLPAAVSPVLVGTGAAATVESAHLGRAVLALIVAMSLQVGVNYANDYSDGVRGTDADRVGPFRLVGSGSARPATVKFAALACFALGALAGLALVIVTAQWWLLAVGVLAVAAAWYYTGGAHPYGYRGFGEVSVFVFFGLVAVIGTTFVQVGRVTASSVVSAIAVGCLACALMLINNVRDASTDADSGKRTLAVFLGQRRSRMLYVLFLTVPFVLAVALSLAGRPWTALALLAVPLAVRNAAAVVRGAHGAELVPVLRDTGLTELVYAILLTIGFVLSAG